MLSVLTFLAEDIGPVGAVLIASILALVIAGGTKRRVLGLVLLVLAMPISSTLATWPLDASTQDFALPTQAPSGDVVVVFGAGVFSDATGGMWPSSRSIERASVGLALSRNLNLPLVVSGGVVRPDLAAEAIVLANVMRLPPDTVLEAEAGTTAENALYVSRIVRERGWQSVILVTSREHTRRAVSSLRSQGVTMSGVVNATAPKAVTLRDVVPSVRGLGRWSPVVHEYVGILWYIITGRIDPASLFG